MKNFVSTQDVQEALVRVDRSKAGRAAAAKRLSRAEEALTKARADVVAADDEKKAAEAALDQLIRRGVNSALKKGGSDLAVAIGQIIAGSLEDDDDGTPSNGANGANGQLPLVPPLGATSHVADAPLSDLSGVVA